MCAGDTLTEGMRLVPLLIQSLEKAVSQPTQLQQMTEAASLANLVAKLLVADHDINGLSGLPPTSCRDDTD